MWLEMMSTTTGRACGGRSWVKAVSSPSICPRSLSNIRSALTYIQTWHIQTVNLTVDTAKSLMACCGFESTAAHELGLALYSSPAVQ